jgi:hypothetical protein
LLAVDADNCYDQIAHPIASLVIQALGVKKEVCESIFTTIQEMKFFLRTGFGDLKEDASATGEIKSKGMCQGNGAAPARWTVDSWPKPPISHHQQNHTSSQHSFCG